MSFFSASQCEARKPLSHFLESVRPGRFTRDILLKSNNTFSKAQKRAVLEDSEQCSCGITLSKVNVRHWHKL